MEKVFNQCGFQELEGWSRYKSKREGQTRDGEPGRPAPRYLYIQSNYSDLISVTRRG